MSIENLPTVNACLNTLSAIFLTLGFVHIKAGRKEAHRNMMVAALITSALFLVCYLIYHYFARHTTFTEPQWFRPYYLALLASHVFLAIAIVPLVIMTVIHAAKGRFEKHKKVAKWTWPLWMYVSVTGVIVYLILYHIFPQG